MRSFQNGKRIIRLIRKSVPTHPTEGVTIYSRLRNRGGL